MNYKKICCFLAGLTFAGFTTGIYAQQKDELIAAASKQNFPNEVFHIEEEEFFSFIKEVEINTADELYDIWTNEKVNPYNTPIGELPDSVHIDCAEYTHPLGGECVITSRFGPRGGRFHYGLDLRVKIGQDVFSAFDGKVRVTGYDRYGYGNYVVVRHNNGFETVYGHLSKIVVEKNQEVKAGEVIGLGGNTGRSSGPHLHLEFRYLGNAINPTKIIDFHTYDIPVPKKEFYMVSKKNSFEEYYDYLSNKPKYHIVRSGETLSSIARKNGTTVSTLCKLNKLKSTSIIRVNQRIRCY